MSVHREEQKYRDLHKGKRCQLRRLRRDCHASAIDQECMSWEHCEAKCIKGEQVVSYAQNADARLNKRKSEN